jgi:hypothetical protein
VEEAALHSTKQVLVVVAVAVYVQQLRLLVVVHHLKLHYLFQPILTTQ